MYDMKEGPCKIIMKSVKIEIKFSMYAEKKTELDSFRKLQFNVVIVSKETWFRLTTLATKKPC